VKKKRKTVKNPRVPRTRAGGEWTEARFWGFLRTGLRQMSRRFPPIARQVRAKYRRENESENRRLKWEYFCSSCGEWFPEKETQVEHTTACGSLKSWEEFKTFAERLFVEVEELRIFCLTCHEEKTKQEKEDRKNDAQ